jgi:hypothetical protein
MARAPASAMTFFASSESCLWVTRITDWDIWFPEN